MPSSSRGARGVALVAVLALSGCLGARRVMVESRLSREASPAPDAGYIAGSFSRIEGSGFGFVVTDAAGQERTITFGESLLGAAIDVTGLVQVPPGPYRVTGWITFQRGSHMTSKQPQDIRPPHPLARAFEVRPGHVVYLGTFDARLTSDMVGSTRRRTWSIRPNALPADEASAVIRKAYPHFAAQAVECLLCTAPRADASAAAMPAYALPTAGKAVALHYHRADGSYEGVGLWVWGTRQGRQRDAAGSSREHPLPPSGVDAFGAYWTMDQGEFNDGRVSFLLRRGAGPAEGEDVRSWLIQDSSDAWVNSDDGFLYLVRKDAERWQTSD